MVARLALQRSLSLLLIVSLLLPFAAAPASAQTPDVEPAPAQRTSAYLPLIGAGAASTTPPAAPTPAPAGPTPIPYRDDGKWPVQLAGATGTMRPSQHGPQRNDPAEGIPAHAYSPFDERNNREYPCPPGGCNVIPGQLLLKLAPDVRLVRSAGAFAAADATLAQALDEVGIVELEPVFPTAKRPRAGEMVTTVDGDVMPKPDLTRWVLATLADEEADLATASSALSASERVVWVEPVYLRKPAGEMQNAERGMGSTKPESRPLGRVATAPAVALSFNDPLYAQQWHLAGANITQAWDYLSSQGLPPGGSRDIVVAVIDTGVDYTHPDLAANMWVNPAEFYGTPGADDDGNGYVDDIHGVTVVSGQRSGDPQDDHGHGTHVAGIIAAQAGNGIGGVGVAHNVQIMAIKAAQYSGVLASSDIAQGIYYAVEKGADVINMSFGGYARSQLEEDALAVAFGQAVLVAAAGNDGKVNLPCPFGRDMYPAAYNWVLGVMARNPSPDAQGDYLAGFSNYDCRLQDSHEYELMAPGVGLWSTLPNGQHAAWSGTSMATPVVAGIAALARTKWADKDVYSSRFIMGQIATTGGLMQAYTPPQGLPVSYYVPDAFLALTTVPQPKLSYLEHWTFDTTAQAAGNDNDGIVDAGETVDLAIVIRNHWGRADNVQVTLAAQAGVVGPDPYVTMITPTVNYGAVGSFNIDDNGLVYENDAIVGVRNPFRFTVDPNTPNDHVIPFRLTITARNGYEPDDPTLFTAVSRFFLLVQRGRELPRIISQDMTLTEDHLWLVSGASLIEAGVRMTVTEGTQMQFWNGDPNDPYSQNHLAYLQVEGNLYIQGRADKPVEMIPTSQHPSRPVEIRKSDSGHVEIRYARVMNPVFWVRPLDILDHSYVRQSTDICITRLEGTNWLCAPIVLYVSSITSTILYRLGFSFPFAPDSPYGRPLINGNLNGNLFDSNTLTLSTQNAQENVFLRNFKLWDAFSYGWMMHSPMPTRADGFGYFCSGCDAATALANNQVKGNAFLNVWWNPNIGYWMRFYGPSSRGNAIYATHNFWATMSTILIDAAIQDFNDDFNMGLYVYQPMLTQPPEKAYPFVTEVIISTSNQTNTAVVGAEPVTFTVTFNRDMDPTVQPAVSFGPDVPLTDYTIHPINGGWADARTWQGTFNITPVTGDGYQLIRVAGARAADDPWLVTGDDAGRFRFEIITSGTESMNLQANGGEGYVDLMWTQTDFDLLAGFNLYRATSADGQYTRINSNIIPAQERSYRDTDVIPGQPYFYKFTVVQTSMAESDFSNIATATPIDTIAPSISHTPVTAAPSGLPLTLVADVTDNVAVTSVTLFHRRSGTSSYSSRAMTKTTGDRYTATLEGSLLVSPGVEYYIQASDGGNGVRNGRPELPHTIVVDDRPTVTSITPNRGTAAGGTVVTIRGSNFKAGVTVSFGSALAEAVQVQSSSQISATTPANIPVKVDVRVTNSDGQSGALLQGYTYEADAISLGVADGNGGQGGSAEIAISAANVRGLVAADLTLSFDSAILRGVSARIGNLTPGWTLATNTSTPGQVRLSLVSTGGAVSGSGVLAHVLFDVIGAPGSSSLLQLGGLSFNDGAISTQVTPGTFTVDNVYDVSGQINFWNGGTISNTQLTLQGERLFTGVTLADGAYTVRGAPAGNYTLTPAKSDEARGISAYDASLALQHAAGVSTLSGHAAIAADVNRSGGINSMDAYYILQKAVDLIALPFPGAGAVWTFDPASRSITGLNAHRTGQNFSAILLGDPSGNWTGGATVAATAEESVAPLVVRVAPTVGNVVTATLWVDVAASPVHAVDLTVQVTGAKVEAMAITLDPQAAGWIEAANVEADGRVQVAAAGAQPFAGGALAVMRFTLQQPADSLTLTPIAAALDEAPVAVRVETPPTAVQRSLYLPILQR